MHHVTPLIGIIVAGLVLAFIFGAVAQRLKLSPLIGYLLAGVAVGPFTPGYVADQNLANEIAELGVILLMFGVGLHFSVKDLWAVRNIAVPGAIAQIGCAMLLGWAMGHFLGWPFAGSLIFGLALSVASTVVLLRALNERRILETERGKIAVGWLIVEDLVMVFALVLIPALAGGGQAIGVTLFLTAAKVVAFIAFMLLIGRRVVPWMLDGIASSGSRELFRLAVLAIALGFAAGAALLFGVSFALGAFFAGIILAESPLSQRAAEETLPLRDAFAVLFFVSVGMLFNPRILVTDTAAVFATLAIIVLGKSLAAYAIVRAFGRTNRTALTIAASLAQIGEFSFILAALGSSLKILPGDARDLILAGAILSIMLNPLLFVLIDKAAPRSADENSSLASHEGHVVLVGYGRVGALVGAQLKSGDKLVVVEIESDAGTLPDALDARMVVGNAADPDVLARAGIKDARVLFVAIPDAFEGGRIVQQARKLNPDLMIVARAHHDEEVAHLSSRGADHMIMGEREIARRMVELAAG